MTSGTSAFSLFKAACKRAQSTLLAQQCWELLRACWQWCANGYNNSQQVGDLPCIATLRFGDHRTKEMFVSCWLKSLTGFKLCATTSNNMQQGVQTDATCNIQQCWQLLENNVASVYTGLKIATKRQGPWILPRHYECGPRVTS